MRSVVLKSQFRRDFKKWIEGAAVESELRAVMQRIADSMHTVRMSMTLDQIVAEARQLPREQAAELFDRLLADAFGAPDVEIEQAWKTETRRRIAEIESGAEPGVPGQQAMAELRRIVGR